MSTRRDELTRQLGTRLKQVNARTGQTRPQPVPSRYAINVRDEFRVRGDGTTDDTARLQDALNAAESDSRPVYVPQGTYLTGDIVQPVTVRIFGDGAHEDNGTHIKALPGTTRLWTVQRGNADLGSGAGFLHNVLLNGDNLSGLTELLYFDGIIVLMDFRNITLWRGGTDAGSWGMNLTEVENCWFSSIHLHNNEGGIRIGSGSNNYFRVQVNKCNESHILIEEGNNNTFVGSQFERRRGTGDPTHRIVELGTGPNQVVATDFFGCNVGPNGAGGKDYYFGPNSIGSGIYGGRVNNKNAPCVEISGAVGTHIKKLDITSGATNWLRSDARTFVMGLTASAGGDPTSIQDNGATDADRVLLIHMASERLTHFPGVFLEGLRDNPTDLVYRSRVVGDASGRLEILANGTMRWGDGSGGIDVALGREAADRIGLASGDSFGPFVVESFTDVTRPVAGEAGRVIFNTDDGNLNIDTGTGWILPDGTAT